MDGITLHLEFMDITIPLSEYDQLMIEGKKKGLLIQWKINLGDLNV